jgi:hypothetical protein
MPLFVKVILEVCDLLWKLAPSPEDGLRMDLGTATLKLEGNSELILEESKVRMKNRTASALSELLSSFSFLQPTRIKTESKRNRKKRFISPSSEWYDLDCQFESQN